MGKESLCLRTQQKNQKKTLCQGPRTRYHPAMSQERLTQLEETVAHLTRQVEELNEIVAHQDTELSKMTHRVQMLMEREAEREASNTGGVVLGDERPPHY